MQHEVREIWNAMKIHKMQLLTNLKKLQRMDENPNQPK